MYKLTNKQNNVLKFIKNYIEENKMPPTIRETADYLGVSIKGAADHITAIERKGFIKKLPKKSRGIIVNE